MKSCPTSFWIVALLGCGSTDALPREPAPVASIVPSAATTVRIAPQPTSAPVARASTAPTADVSPWPIEASPEQLSALTAELQNRRVFRYLTLGNKPVRERNTWLLSEDRSSLTLVCEGEEEGRIESGSPVPKRWFVLSSLTLSASEPPTGTSWVASFRRVGSMQVRYAPQTLCTELGEELTLDCASASIKLHGPAAFVPVETREEEPVRWRPSAVRLVRGLACSARADAFEGSVYRSSAEPKQPMVFFADGKIPVERLVHSGPKDYAGFRESTLTPFDGSLPEYRRTP
jgi:hypothetical protein